MTPNWAPPVTPLPFGVSSGATLLAVNGQEYTHDALKQAIAEARGGTAPIVLTLKFQGGVRSVEVNYHDGLQYPHLVRVDGTPDSLSQIIAARR